MEKLKMLKEEIIMLNNIYAKKIKEFDEKYDGKEEIDNEEDYIMLIATESAHATLSTVIERIDQIMDIEN